MIKHTPAPWTIADENNQCCSVLLGGQHNLTCSLDRQDGNTGQTVIERSEMLANARLIAAAPELLESLKMMVEMYETIQPSGGYQGVYDISCAAIAKAKGEPA